MTPPRFLYQSRFIRGKQGRHMTHHSTDIVAFRLPDEGTKSPAPADLQALIRLLSKYAPHDDGFDLTRHGVKVFKASKPQAEKTHMLSQPSICIVPQGSKSVSFATQSFAYDKTKMVVYAAEIPINVKVTQATTKEPYFCLVIPLEPHRLNELILKVFPNGVPKTDKSRAVYVGDSNPKIIKSAVRMMELIEQQEDVDLLVPLVIDEILIRLLRSPAGPSIAQIAITDSHAEKVAKAISWFKDNYAQTIKMEDLAKTAGMSISSFHTHFKAITAMSPLQFQKTLRLQEARHLIRTKMMDVSSAAFEVGYASPSQFSREYTREFGVTPSKDATP